MRRLAARALASVSVVCASAATAAGERPNIVFILADDLGYGDCRAYNPESKIPTPHIDRLAREGIRFTDAHSPSAVCTPTRYGILTGRYAWRTPLQKGVLDGYSPALIEPGRMTVASLLQKHGYTTACIGKWHLGLQSGAKTDYARPLAPGPNAAGFDSFFGIPASLDMDPYVFIENERLLAAPSESIAASRPRRAGGEGFWRAGGIAPGFRHAGVLSRITEEAVKAIEKHGPGSDEKPFFLYFALSAPHTPWLPGEEFRGKSGAGPYGDFAAQVDWSAGRVLEALDRTGARDRTLVFLASDNGAHWTPADIARYGHRANGPLRGQKADIWEGGHRVPFVARWPGRIPAGVTNDETVCLVDLLATVAALLDAPLPAGAGEDSHDLLPALLGKARETPLREATVHHAFDGMFAIRQGRWKLILGRGSGGFTPPRRVEPKSGEPAGQLYDLAADPGETRNLYGERPDVVGELGALLEAYRRQGRSRG